MTTLIFKSTVLSICLTISPLHALRMQALSASKKKTDKNACVKSFIGASHAHKRNFCLILS